MPLGIVPELKFATEEAQLMPGSRMLIYTDGLAETRAADGEFYGYDRLVDWLERTSKDGQSLAEMKNELIVEMARFQQGDLLQDDQTFVILAG